MQIIRRISDLERATGEWRAARQTVALVPTMGALHDGHLALVADGKDRAARVLATIFVNPLQFNDKTDLDRYPRTEAADLAKLEAAGCDAVWLPAAAELYPDGFATTVSVGGVSDRWEGAHRPGHFDGVATIVAKLLIATRPDMAIFGEKDWQQLAVIRRIERDLGLGFAIIGHPTVREADGLALSSRNALLTTEQRASAAALPAALAAAGAAIARGEAVDGVLAAARTRLSEAGFDPIDYFAYVDGATLEPFGTPAPGARLLAAASLGNVRLIDNLSVEMDTVSNMVPAALTI